MAVVLIKHSYMGWYESKCVKMNSKVEQSEKSWEQPRVKYKRTGFCVVFISFIAQMLVTNEYSWLVHIKSIRSALLISSSLTSDYLTLYFKIINYCYILISFSCQGPS